MYIAQKWKSLSLHAKTLFYSYILTCFFVLCSEVITAPGKIFQIIAILVSLIMVVYFSTGHTIVGKLFGTSTCLNIQKDAEYRRVRYASFLSLVLVLTQVNFVIQILKEAPLWLKMAYHISWMGFGLFTMIVKWQQYGMSCEEQLIYKTQNKGIEKGVSNIADGLGIVFLVLILLIVFFI